MINKVLIAEDHESANLSVQMTLKEMGLSDPTHVYYCDDALLKIQKGMQDDDPYDLLITDLYFEEDDSRQKLSGGMALITAARKIQPELKVLVFSAEKKPAVIEVLFETQGVDGYVRKARSDARELKTAIELIGKNQRYFPRHLKQLIGKKNAHGFKPYDVTILTLMAQGMRQKDIPAYLRQRKIKPSGLSSIEKRLNLIKEALDFSNNEQLIAYCKETGII
jgi:two-component system capsular synthesis response regulator RcsB